MSVMIVGEAERLAIAEAIKQARANPIPLRVGQSFAPDRPTTRLMLRDRKPGTEEIRQFYPPQHVMLGTYRTAFSFEEQPAGLMRHLSVSSAARDKVPGPEAMQMACEAFGFSEALCKIIGSPRATLFSPERPFRAWVEEFEPGRFAINVIELVE